MPPRNHTRMHTTHPKLEIERRWLVPLPLKWYARFKLHCASKVGIHQTYLKEPGEANSRVRVVAVNNRYSYTYTRKKQVKIGVCEEIEIALNSSQYAYRLGRTDPLLHTIIKDRYVFSFQHQKCELDIFKGQLEGLAILEIELQFVGQNVLIPPFLKVSREITGLDYYANMNLAALDCAPNTTNDHHNPIEQ
jgi:CYTH domain-containing protein